jgi:hypothetical protein
LLEIDEDMLVKLQSDLITVAVFGMQDGCDLLRKKAAANPDAARRRSTRLLIEGELQDGRIEGETELERLRRENAKLLKLLGEKPGPQ